MSKAKTGRPLYWNLERCREDALRFDSRDQWGKSSGGAYSSAKKHGWLDDCCSHMITKGEAVTRKKLQWTLGKCLTDAKRFTGRREWSIKSSAAYGSAKRNGWLDQCCAHMDSGFTATDNDVVYIWRDAGTDLHKVGVTSARIGEQRIRLCKSHNDMDPQIVFMLKVPDARAVELRLLELGTDPELDSSIDGYTEFRRLTDAELGQAVSIAYEAALAA